MTILNEYTRVDDNNENNYKNTGTLRKTWVYFKKGKNESAFLLSIYNTVLIWWNLGNWDAYFKNMKLFIILFFPTFIIISILVGKYVTRNVDTTNPYINPFTQDNISAGILSSEALMDFFDGNIGLAKTKIKQSITIRERWMDKWLK
jgi:hypothetical protein